MFQVHNNIYSATNYNIQGVYSCAILVYRRLCGYGYIIIIISSTHVNSCIVMPPISSRVLVFDTPF